MHIFATPPAIKDYCFQIQNQSSKKSTQHYETPNYKEQKNKTAQLSLISDFIKPPKAGVGSDQRSRSSIGRTSIRYKFDHLVTPR